jgi:hypothetical protein
MTLNPAVLTQLETYGLTNEHLEQLLAVCQRASGRLTWHLHQHCIAKVEVTLFAEQRDSRGMRDLTHLLAKGVR